MIEIRRADDPASLAAARALVRAHILAHSSAHDAAGAERIVDALPAPYVAPTGVLIQFELPAMFVLSSAGSTTTREIPPEGVKVGVDTAPVTGSRTE